MKMHKYAWLLLLVSCAGTSGTDAAADSAGLAGGRRYFVGFSTRPDKSHRDKVKKHGAKVVHDFADQGALAVDVDAAQAAELAREAGVDYVEEDPPRQATTLDSQQLAPAQSNGLYGLVTTRATDAQAAGVTGAGIIIGVADTGLDCSHPDIQPQLISSRSFVTGDPAVSGCVGQAGIDPVVEEHATHVSGIALGAFNGVGIFGMAYGARLVHARVLGPNGGTTSDIMAGVRALVDSGAKIINLSLGGGRSSRTESKFYADLYKNRGVLVAAATGNDSARKISFPAAYAQNIAVGAVDRTNAHASFSNTGREIDVSAPGVSVLSSVPVGTGHEAAVSASSGTLQAAGMEFAGNTTANGVRGTLVDCALGQAGEFPAAVRGNVALIQRGTITFADKVTNAMNAGAVAAVIYNNVAGDLTGTLGAAGSWIPAVSVSDAAGAQLKAQAGSTVTVLNQISNWDLFDGTSMATPHVAGALALIWSKKPSAANTAVEQALYSTCTDLGAAGFDTTFGHGLINAAAAAAALH
jgi:subtilisin family serine protease